MGINHIYECGADQYCQLLSSSVTLFIQELVASLMDESVLVYYPSEDSDPPTSNIPLGSRDDPKQISSIRLSRVD